MRREKKRGDGDREIGRGKHLIRFSETERGGHQFKIKCRQKNNIKRQRKQIQRETEDGKRRRCLCPHPVACCFKSGSGSLIRLSQQSLRELTIRTELELNTHKYAHAHILTNQCDSHTQSYTHNLSCKHPLPKFYTSLPTHTKCCTHTFSLFYKCLGTL